LSRLHFFTSKNNTGGRKYVKKSKYYLKTFWGAGHDAAHSYNSSYEGGIDRRITAQAIL
jgi:hypothetical protein